MAENHIEMKFVTSSRRPPITAKRIRNVGLAAALLCFLAGAAQAQVLSAVSSEGDVLVMPGAPMPAAAIIDGVQLSVADEGNFRVYRATLNGETHTTRVALDGPPKHMAFDPERERFREVTPSVIVELSDYALLDEVVESSGVLAGKAYPELGFAIVQLPETLNPAEAARALLGHPAVDAARVQLAGPLRVPL